jgi:hypothetical protein
LTLRRPERFASVDAGIYGHVTRRNLAKLAAEQGDRAEAVRQWSAILAELPCDAEAIGAMTRLRYQPAVAERPGEGSDRQASGPP